MSEAYQSDLLWPWGDLRPNHYRCILADPPWLFRNFSEKGEGKNPNQHYPCMPLADIAALPVADLAHPEGCVLIVWGTAPMLPEALALMHEWGFRFKSMGAWAKQSSTGKRWAFGPGYTYRSAMEPWILGTRGHPHPLVRNVRNLIVSPVRRHSEKPDEMKATLQRQWAGPYCELFGRKSGDDGWHVWGDEVGKLDD